LPKRILTAVLSKDNFLDFIIFIVIANFSFKIFLDNVNCKNIYQLITIKGREESHQQTDLLNQPTGETPWDPIQ